MKRNCACGQSWEGDGACPACAILASATSRALEKKLEQLRQGFASLIKIAADTPTAAKKPENIGPLMSAAWRIRQLGKERVEALERVKELEAELAQEKEEGISGKTQDRIRDAVIRASGAPDGTIDGGGCESGDPVDLTITEIELGFVFLGDKHDEKVAELEKKLADLEKKILSESEALEDSSSHAGPGAQEEEGE